MRNHRILVVVFVVLITVYSSWDQSSCPWRCATVGLRPLSTSSPATRPSWCCPVIRTCPQRQRSSISGTHGNTLRPWRHTTTDDVEDRSWLNWNHNITTYYYHNYYKGSVGVYLCFLVNERCKFCKPLNITFVKRTKCWIRRLELNVIRWLWWGSNYW